MNMGCLLFWENNQQWATVMKQGYKQTEKLLAVGIKRLYFIIIYMKKPPIQITELPDHSAVLLYGEMKHRSNIEGF